MCVKCVLVYLDEGLVVQRGVGLLKAHTLLLVLLQSQGVDGEQRHVGLGGKETLYTWPQGNVRLVMLG